MKRYSYASLPSIVDLPNLIEIQHKSYERFLKEGLHDLFESIFPVKDFTGNLSLEFVDYQFDKPRFTIEECRDRDMHYAAPLRMKFRLVNKDTGEIKEQDVLLGDFPLMTPYGTFIINGAERVVVSQLTRSPGVYFKINPTRGEGNTYYAKVIPNRGSWIEMEMEPSGAMFLKIERSRKIPATLVLKALGLGDTVALHKLFGKKEKVQDVTFANMLGNIPVKDIADPKTGEVIAKANAIIDEEAAKKIEFRVKHEVELWLTEEAMRKTLEQDSAKTQAEAQLDLYRRVRPGDPPTAESARNLLTSLFSDPRRYDLGRVGRYKINKKFGRDYSNKSLSFPTLTADDFTDMVRYMINLNKGIGEDDDIDHLGNRRVRSVGELLTNALRVGLLRMEKIAKERMMIQEKDQITPQSIINIRPVISVINEFFGTSQLSQFMDQTNPLAELTHKRRLSALGVGGLSRDRAGFEVRDVHHSHYGRICPIETPEGPNIGLINSMCSFARINELGFMITPYRKVVKGRETDEIVYLTADEEDKYVIAQANAGISEDGRLIDAKVVSRHKKDHILIEPEKVDFIDVSPKQVVSVSAALIPFLEHDDANRALMGSNMQRQAVPLIKTSAPLIATGVEERVAQDSGAVVRAQISGTVADVTSTRIEISGGGREKEVHTLRKFARSNQATCINQKPIVSVGQKVKKDEVVADGPCTDNGELALGKNILVAYMPWRGFNFEDAIVISERLTREDVFTSLHIEEYETEARETKLGPEEITKDTPNVSEDQLKDLDDRGVIRVGAEVKSEDILVGKITPKGETELTPEERLLRAIFGEKAREMRDTSLRVPHGGKGKVVEVKVFSREQGDELPPGVNQLVRVYVAQRRKVSEGDKMAGRHGNKGVIARIMPDEDMPYLSDGTPVDMVLNPLGVPSRMNIGQIFEAHLAWAAFNLGIRIATPIFDGAKEEQIKEILAVVRLLREGEVKAANSKGEIFTIRLQGVDADEKEKSFGNVEKVVQLFKKASIVLFNRRDEVLATFNFNELTSKEIIESWTKGAFFKIAPLSKGKDSDYSIKEVRELLEELQMQESGKMKLYDGRRGEPFDQEVTVGLAYILKLAHLVDDKIHARSTGPYALVTQQPLGGKAQFGGQRFGEMEVWALEAYGAAYTLQELLTVKSDDVVGRVRTYESIIKGEPILEPGLPESFKVLIKELQALALDVKLVSEDKTFVDIPEMEEVVETPDKELERELT